MISIRHRLLAVSLRPSKDASIGDGSTRVQMESLVFQPLCAGSCWTKKKDMYCDHVVACKAAFPPFRKSRQADYASLGRKLRLVCISFMYGGHGCQYALQVTPSNPAQIHYVDSTLLTIWFPSSTNKRPPRMQKQLHRMVVFLRALPKTMQCKRCVRPPALAPQHTCPGRTDFCRVSKSDLTRSTSREACVSHANGLCEHHFKTMKSLVGCKELARQDSSGSHSLEMQCLVRRLACLS